MDALLTSAEAANILRIHPKVLERKAKAGEIPALKVGKFWRYRSSDLESWVGSQVNCGCQACRIEPSF
jgi:excisionase family DNA binding protein